MAIHAGLLTSTDSESELSRQRNPHRFSRCGKRSRFAEGASFADAISSPAPIAFWKREIIGFDGAGGIYLHGERVDECNLASAIKGTSNNRELAAFLFWSRAPFAERAAEGSVLIRDARYYDPRARNRFSVALPDVRCDPIS